MGGPELKSQGQIDQRRYTRYNSREILIETAHV